MVRLPSWLSQAFQLLLLLLVLAISASDIRPGPTYVPLVVSLLALLAALCRYFFPRYGVSILILSCFTLPFLSRGALTFVVASYFVGRALRQVVHSASRERSEPQQVAHSVAHSVAHPVALGLLVMFAAQLASTLQTALLEVDFQVWRTIFVHGGFSGLLSYVVADQSYFRSALRVLVISLVGLFIFSERELFWHHWRTALLSVVWASALALAYFFGQLIIGGEFFSLSRGPVWFHLNRYSGPFSDPNAAGVMILLVLPLLVAAALPRLVAQPLSIQSRYISAMLAAGLLLFASYSGSRTFWLGGAVWSLICFRAWLQRRGLNNRLAITVVLVVLVGVGFTLSYPQVTETLRQGVQNFAPKLTGLERTLATVDSSTAREALDSRIVFSRIAWKMTQESQFVGVGLGRFPAELHQVASLLEINLGQWWDNANNFYLQLISEMGVLGSICYLWGVWLVVAQLRRANLPLFLQASSPLQQLAQLTLAVLLIVLLTGPHLLFEEVSYFTIILLILASFPAVSPGLSSARAVRQKVALPVALLALLIGLSGTYRASEQRRFWGFYPIETNSEGVFLWSTERARIRNCPIMSLRIRALHPDLAASPVTVKLSSRGPASAQADSQSIVIDRSAWLDLPISVSADSGLDLQVSRLWSPASAAGAGVGTDPRWLGVQLAQPSCELTY